MDGQIPLIIEELYFQFSPGPMPNFWPERLQDNPVQGHGMWSFYQGLKLGMRLSAACLDQL